MSKGLRLLEQNKEPQLASNKAINKEQQKAISKVLTLVSQAKELLTSVLKPVIFDFYCFCHKVEMPQSFSFV